MAAIKRFVNSKIVLAMSILWLLHLFGRPIEGFLFPVVTHFNVSKIEAQLVRLDDKPINEITVTGDMIIARRCDRFVGFNIEGSDADGSLTDLDFKFRDNVRSDKTRRGPGYHKWGPWTIDIPNEHIDFVKLYSVHDCHPFWFTKTPLTTIPIEWVKE